jgi:hypothetical protein
VDLDVVSVEEAIDQVSEGGISGAMEDVCIINMAGRIMDQAVDTI